MKGRPELANVMGWSHGDVGRDFKFFVINYRYLH